MILRSLSLSLTFAALVLNGNLLYASCAGCCHGESIVSSATATAAAAGLPGLPGAAMLPGLAGVPGVPGVVGPAGIANTAGGVGEYAFLFNTVGDGQNVGPGGNVPFNLPAPATITVYISPTATFDHNGTSSILFIHTPGTYVARYAVTVSLATHGVPTTFELTLAGIPIPGSNRSSDIPNGAGEVTMVGEAIFVIPTLPALPAPGLPLAVTNSMNGLAGVNTFIGVSAPATTAASLFVQKLAN